MVLVFGHLVRVYTTLRFAPTIYNYESSTTVKNTIDQGVQNGLLCKNVPTKFTAMENKNLSRHHISQWTFQNRWISQQMLRHFYKCFYFFIKALKFTRNIFTVGNYFAVFEFISKYIKPWPRVRLTLRLVWPMNQQQAPLSSATTSSLLEVGNFVHTTHTTTRVVRIHQSYFNEMQVHVHIISLSPMTPFYTTALLSFEPI